MATENIMMDAVKKGGDRQQLHERIRIHSVAAGAVVKEQGLENDLISRIASDPLFGLTEEEIRRSMDARAYVGRAPQQVTEFLEQDVKPVLQRFASLLSDKGAELKV